MTEQDNELPGVIYVNGGLIGYRRRLHQDNLIMYRKNGVDPAKYDREVTELKRLLKIAVCPNSECVDGDIPRQLTEAYWEAEQCQFCFERNESMGETTPQEQTPGK